MFTLQDGREHLWQWDLQRYVIVNDPTISEVHFCNRTTDSSLVVEVKDGLAAIPNILLQDARPIRVYAYCDDCFTLTEQQFTVKARTKPSDYRYEETTVIRIDVLLDRAEEAVTLAEQSATAADKTATDLYEYVDTHTLTFTDDDAGNVILEGVETGSDTDLSNYYTKEETDTAISTAIADIDIPTNVSAFNNDAGYLTQHQSLEGYATETYVDTAIADLDIPDVTYAADTYFLDTTTLEWGAYRTQIYATLPEEFNEFGRRIENGKQAHIYLKTGEYWQPARWCYKDSRIYLTRTPTWEDMGTEVTIDNFYLQRYTTGTSEYWSIAYYTDQSSKYHIATKQYVDEVLGVIENGSY